MPSPAWMVDLSSTMPACTRTWWNCCWDQRKVPAPTTTVWWWIKDGVPRCWWNHNIQVEHLKFAGVEIYLFQDGFNPIIIPSFSPSSELWFSHHSRFMNHHDFAFDDTFGESANNAEVYEGTARQLVLDALEGKQGTVMMWPGYGWDVGDGMGMAKSNILYIFYIIIPYCLGGWRSISHLLFTRDQRLWLVEMWIRDVVCCLLELLGCGWILSHIPSLQWSLISFSTM